jgi:hypothetical protein
MRLAIAMVHSAAITQHDSFTMSDFEASVDERALYIRQESVVLHHLSDYLTRILEELNKIS